MNRRLLLALFAGAWGCAHAAESPSDFAFALAIEGVGGDALYRVAVPPRAHESAAFADLRDMRVFNGAGEVVPHAFAPVAPAAHRPAPVGLPFFPVRGPRGARADDLNLALESSGGKVNLRVKLRDGAAAPTVLLGYLVDASALEQTLSAVQLEWGDLPAGYVGALRVEASDDLRHWETLADRAPIVSLTHGGHRLEQKTVGFRPRRAKYLRLSWGAEPAPMEVTGVTGIPVEEWQAPARVWKQVAAPPDPRRAGDYPADLGGALPVDRVMIRLPQDNAVAPIRIFVRDQPADEWRQMTSTVAYRLRQGEAAIASPEIAVTPTAHRYWLLRVDQKGGGVGEGAIQLDVGWIAREIVFAARGAGPFILAVGNGRAQSNALAIETLVPGWGSQSAPRVAVAAIGKVEPLAGEAAARRRIDMKKVGLWAALFAGVALLGFMAWRLSRQLQHAKETSDR
jgi:hypothetical protein